MAATEKPKTGATPEEKPGAGPGSAPPVEKPAEQLAAEKRIEQLEAENQRLRDAAAAPAGEIRLAWVVTYPEISAQPKDDDGKPVGEPITLKEGETLPANCEWNARFLASIGHVRALQITA